MKTKLNLPSGKGSQNHLQEMNEISRLYLLSLNGALNGNFI